MSMTPQGIGEEMQHIDGQQVLGHSTVSKSHLLVDTWGSAISHKPYVLQEMMSL